MDKINENSDNLYIEGNDQDKKEKFLRPKNLKTFIGQTDSKDNLETFLFSAKKRKAALDHTLLIGPPGLGKTTLAQIIANELGVNFFSTSGPVLNKAGDLSALLTNLEPRDVLFIDEIHRLNIIVEEHLYPALEDFQLDLIIGEGHAARSLRIDLPEFTLIGATTRSGLISNPLRDRFGINLRMQFYSIEELKMILLQASKELNIELLNEGANEIALRSRGTPRIAGRMLRRVRDFIVVSNKNYIDKEQADKALTKMQVDNLGLDTMDRRYLNQIARFHNGGPVGIDTIAAALSEQRDVIEEVIEPYLIQKGFVFRTPRGRMLSKTCWKYLGLPIPDHFQEIEKN